MDKLTGESAKALLRAAYSMLGDGDGGEWGDPEHNEYTRGVAELVSELIDIPGGGDIDERRFVALRRIRASVQPKVISSRAELREFARVHGLRPDWHEPDEQGIKAVVVGHDFDNAMGPRADGEGAHIDMQVNLLDDEGNVLAMVNLATLFAIAAS